MRCLRPLALFLRDHAWAVATLAASAAVQALSIAMTGGGTLNWLYSIALSLTVLLLVLMVRLALSWGFYRRVSQAETKGVDWSAVEGVTAAARWSKLAAQETRRSCERDIERYSGDRAERDALVLSWVHHAKTPVAVILLAAESEDGDMGRISRAAHELDRSLNSLLQAVRVDSPASDLRIDKLDVHRCARDAINGLKDLFIEREVFPVLALDGCPVAYGDGKMLEIILEQLLVNAAKYSPPSSRVAVTITGESGEGTLDILIEDEGCGITEEDVGRVFEPFFTGKNGRRGESSTGIGLFLAKRAADATGAQLSVARREGGGTSARVTLRAPVGTAS